MSQLSKTAFESLYQNSGGTFADNTSAQISEGDLRQFADDIADSFVNIIDGTTVDTFTDEFFDWEWGGSGLPGGFRVTNSGAGSGMGTSGLGMDSTENAIGIAALGTGTTTTGYCHLHRAQVGTIRFGTGWTFILKIRLSMTALSDGTNTFTIYFGYGDTVAGTEFANGAYFRYTHSVNGGEYEAVTADGGVRTVSDTNVVAVAATFKIFEIRMNSAGSSCEFRIDGVTVATNTTNIDTTVTTMGINNLILKSAGTTDRFLEIDYHQQTKSRTTAR